MTLKSEAKRFLEGSAFQNLSKTACDYGIADSKTIENLKNEA